MKCDKCDKPATVHLIEIVEGQKIEKHLCEEHAVEDGVATKVTQAPINELLEKFVLKHTGSESREAELGCESCGLTYGEFRKKGLLGCPQCYEAFEPVLGPMLERAHEGSSRHLGKVPVHAGPDERRQQRLLQLRRELDRAVASEAYERAASIRDQVRQLEAEQP
jgi:protein arginine kinase activator